MPQWFLPGLMGWSIAMVFAGVIGLAVVKTKGCWFGLWLMTGLWAGVNLAICLSAILKPVTDEAEFRRLLLINAGLDVLYILVAVGLIVGGTKKNKPVVVGLGWGIVPQAVFLGVYDVAWSAVM